MKKQPIELIPGLRIGVGVGRLILSHKTVDDDGLERWAVNYHLTVGGPIRESFFMSANVLRYIAKVETLERDLKSSKEYSRRLKIRKEELEAQLAKSENLRDVAQKTNKQRIDELEGENAELNLKIKSQYNELVRRNTSITNDFLAYEKEAESRLQTKSKEANQLNSIINSEKDQNKIAFKIIDKLKFWNMVCSILGLMFFALWLSAMYF
jgi:chromosome segregation ATPase